MGTQAPPIEEITLLNRKMMPPILPARDPARNQPNVVPNVVTTDSWAEETTVTTTAFVSDSSMVNSTADITVPTTASSESTSMLISAITSTKIMSTAVTTANEDVVHLESSDSDTEDDEILGEMPAIEVDTDDYDDWLPLLKNKSSHQNRR